MLIVSQEKKFVNNVKEIQSFGGSACLPVYYMLFPTGPTEYGDDGMLIISGYFISRLIGQFSLITYIPPK